jgi:hypothetical protein
LKERLAENVYLYRNYIAQENIHLSDDKYDAFISYASEDGWVYALQLKEQLEHERYGLKIWLAKKKLELGDGLRSGLDKGLVESNYKIVVLTKIYFKKYWTTQELNGMFAQEAYSDKKLILPVCYNMSLKELVECSPILAGRLVVPPNTGLEETTLVLFNVIKQSKVINTFDSDTKLRTILSKLFKSVLEIEEEALNIILIKIYLVAEAYSYSFIYYQPFVERFIPNEQIDTFDRILNKLAESKFIQSKATATFSITYEGIKKVERLIEDEARLAPNSPRLQFIKSISQTDRLWILETQRLRYTILKKAFDLSKQGIHDFNIHLLAEPIINENNKLSKVYFYLEDAGLTKFYVLGGGFVITENGKKFVEENPIDRIL